MMQYKELNDDVFFHFAVNDTAGSGDDGATPLCDVRLAGAAASAAPVFSPTPVLLTDAGYPDGAYEVEIAATSGNGFAADSTYAVFVTITADSQTPIGFVGSFTLSPVLSNVSNMQAGTIDNASIVDDAITSFKIGDNFLTANKIAAAAIGASEFTAMSESTIADAVWDEASAGHTDAGKAGEQLWTDIDAILADTGELQVDDVPGLIAAIWTTQMADSVPADGTIATREQAQYMILQMLTEFAISGTTMTIRKVNGSTSLFTLTLDDDTSPTSLTRAT